MSDYLGRIITKTPTPPSPTSASGVWTLDEALQYQKAGKWPPGYAISRSVRLRMSATAYFNRTPASAGSRKIWTWSGWFKRGDSSNTTGSGAASELTIFGSGTSAVAGNGVCTIGFTGYNQLQAWQYNSGTIWNVVSTQVLSDYSAWYHFVVSVDTTQATSSDRVKIYLNGSQITALAVASYPSQNYDTGINSTDVHNISRRPDAQNYWGGYLAETYFIDGQALTPASFGYTDTATGVWQPLPYTGTYGTNGFYLNFSDNSAATATTIGKDYSGNGNNWTPNNISVSAGSVYDSMLDTPTAYGTDRGNYCVWNYNFRFSYSGAFAGTFSNGNLQVATGGNPSQFAGSMALPDGAYFEVTPSSIDVNRTYVGLFAVSRSNLVTSTAVNAYNGTYNVLYSNDGTIWVNTTTGSNIYGTVSTYTNSDVISVAYKSGKIYFAKNGVWQNSGVPASGTGFVASGWDAYGDLLPYCGFNSTFTGNFGQQPFSYTVPTGFVGVCDANLSAPTINNGANYMAATLYTGNGATQTIANTVNNISFQPDLVWQKNRSSAANNILLDSVRGGALYLITNSTSADLSAPGYMTFNSNGATFSSSDIATNQSGQTYVAWQWLAGKGTTSSNTSGSITSTVSVNQTAGFSVVTYTGTGANATVGHGLGVAPSMVIIKDRTSGSRTVSQWPVYHSSVGNTKGLFLNATDAAFADSTYWQNTTPTSSVFSIGSWGGLNYSGDAYVAYCFAAIAGYSAFGTYTGNGSTDGPFIYLGFRPRWIMIKRTDTTSDWQIQDTSRMPYNWICAALYADLSNAENTTEVEATYGRYYVSNGCKIKSSHSSTNASGGTYIYMAFAENPFKYARAR